MSRKQEKDDLITAINNTAALLGEAVETDGKNINQLRKLKADLDAKLSGSTEGVDTSGADADADAEPEEETEAMVEVTDKVRSLCFKKAGTRETGAQVPRSSLSEEEYENCINRGYIKDVK